MTEQQGRSRRHDTRARFGIVLRYVPLILIGLVIIVPFLWMMSTALKSDDEVLSYPPSLLPAVPQWSNLAKVFTAVPFARYMMNSMIVSFSVMAGQLLVASLSAYAFARLEFPGRDAVFFLFMATMMVPGQVIIIPQFILMRYLKWIDTYQALILPGVFEAFGAFILRQFFLSIPKALEEAAIIDGCSRLRIYAQIVLPLSKPAMATLGTLTFMKYWNDFMWPLIVTHTDKMMVLPVGLSTFSDLYLTKWNLLMAGAALGLIPVLVLYCFFQQYFEKGVVITGLKG